MNRLSPYLRECRSLLAIAWPTMIAQLAQMGTGVVDTLMAGHYSAVDLAAIAIGYNIWLPLFLLTLGIMLATSVIVAQDYGAQRWQRIRDTLPQALWLALLLGALVGPALYRTEPLLDLLGLDPVTHDKSLGYLQAVAWGMPATVIFQALRCHTQGLGVMRPFAVASVIGFCANIPLNYAFIYGQWGIPEMGATGCGWATAISMWLGTALIAIYLLLARDLRPYLPPLKLVAPNWALIGEICVVGIPVGLTFFLDIGVFSVIGLLIATLGNTAMAAHQIAYNVWDVLYMPLISVGTAMATRVGHAIGAGQPAAVRLAAHCGLFITLAVGLASTLVLLTLPDLIVRAYTSDGAITAIARRLLQLAALFVIIDALQIATAYGLRAFKDTRFPFLVTCVAYWLIALPLGYWLGIQRADNPLDGALGFWTSLIIGIGISAVLVSWRFFRTLNRPTGDRSEATGNVL